MPGHAPVCMHHLAPQNYHTELVSDSTLHVIGVISNTEQYHSRYRLAREWIERMSHTPNVVLHLVEVAFGDRHHELELPPHLDPADGHNVLRLRTKTNIWVKENMINLGVRALLPRDWKYAAWVDCDVEHRDPNWALKTIHQLQHFAIVQPWENCLDLGPNGSVYQTHTSFGAVDQSGQRKQRHAGEPYKYAHSGYAWACTRAFWEQTGGLLDIGILGSGDHHMAWGAIGQVEHSVHGQMSDGYKRACKAWSTKAVRASHNEVGFVPGRIEHHFHGPKSKRYYRERWQILVDNHFDPEVDIHRDEQGLMYVANKPALEQAIRKYNRSRAEDSIELE